MNYDDDDVSVVIYHQRYHHSFQFLFFFPVTPILVNIYFAHFSLSLSFSPSFSIFSFFFDRESLGTHTSRQWQHLRDQYRRAKRRMEVSNVQIKPWRFMQMLKFTDATDIAEANDPM